jgi:hypothetical protein
MNVEGRASERLSEGNARSALRVPRWRLMVLANAAGVGRSARWRTALFVFVLGIVLALPSSALALRRGFDGLYGQDAYAYFDYATISVRSSILHLAPLEPFFWPPGYSVLVGLASLVIGPNPLAGQVVSLAAGAAVPVLTALLVHAVWPNDRAVAFLAGLLVALCGQLWQSSIVVMADTTGLALATFSAWALVRYAKSAAIGWLLAASAALACAMLARWIYGLVAVPLAGYALWALPRSKPGRAARHALAALGLAAALLGPVLGPPLFGLVTQPGEPASFAGNLQVYSWSPANALQRDFFTADGHLSYSQPNGIYYALAPANLAFFGPLLAPWALVGLWAAMRDWRRPTLLLVVGWAATVYAFHAGAPWQNFRFTLAYLPPLAILVAEGLVWTWRRSGFSFAQREGPRVHPARVLVGACASLGLLSTSFGAARLVDGFIDRKDDDLALVRWVQTQTGSSARLLSFGPTLTLRHYTSLPTLDLYDLSPAALSEAMASASANGQPTYVLVDEANLDAQWIGQAPATNVARLRAGPGLAPVGTYGSYTLFRVGSG